MATKRIRGIVTAIPGTLLVALFLLISLKSCVVTLWSPPSQPEAYSIHGADGRSLTVVLLPTHDVFMSFVEPQRSIEVVRATFHGSYATHYFGPFWNQGADGGSLLGVRTYTSGIKPVIMEIETLQKSYFGVGESQSPRIGDRRRAVVLFAADSMRFSDMWLRREPTDAALVARLQAALGR